MGLIVILLIVYNFPKSWISILKTHWKRRFPPKLKLLTNEEYYEQGARETTKALNNLKEYCISLDCNQWELMLKLKDAKRFASFIRGNPHLSDSEIMEYEYAMSNKEDDDMLTDDED